MDIGDKNLAIYGENGAGKSSLYEALKIIFFKSRIEQSIVNAPTPEGQEALAKEFWSKYNNKISDKNFIINIDGVNYTGFSDNVYQVFMISLDDFKREKDLQLDELLEQHYFNIENINQFCSDNYSSIETNVNNSLDEFNENISIAIDNQDDYKIKIKDIKRNIERKSGIKDFFNEAKINLITLLILFYSIKQSKKEDKIKLLVLDDFITSLDVSNRTYFLNFLFDNFNDFKLMIFSHNISFYNLIMYFVNDIFKIKEKWMFANLYEIDT